MPKEKGEKAKNVSVDELAVIIQNGFSDMQSELGTIRADIRDIKGTLGPLMRALSHQEKEVADFSRRIRRLEGRLDIKETDLFF